MRYIQCKCNHNTVRDSSYCNTRDSFHWTFIHKYKGNVCKCENIVPDKILKRKCVDCKNEIHQLQYINIDDTTTSP